MSSAGPDKLVYMANQIAAFFGSQPGETKALRVADHLTAFWDPRMRRTIIEHLDHGGAGLKPVALEAVKVLKTRSAARIEQTLAKTGEVSPGLTTEDDAG